MLITLTFITQKKGEKKKRFTISLTTRIKRLAGQTRFLQSHIIARKQTHLIWNEPGVMLNKWKRIASQTLFTNAGISASRNSYTHYQWQVGKYGQM